MLLVVDNGSLYTQNLTEFISSNKTKFHELAHNKINLSSLNKYDSFILSGRRSNDQEMNVLNSSIIKHSISKKKPVLGICYGAEILTLTLGGTIKKSDSPKKGNQIVTITEKNPLCKGTIDVFESHSYEISLLADSLVRIATSDTCKNEIVRYGNSNIFGIQFHPEVTLDGKNLIKKFCFLE